MFFWYLKVFFGEKNLLNIEISLMFFVEICVLIGLLNLDYVK